MNQTRRSVESLQTNAVRLSAISLPVAEWQGYRRVAAFDIVIDVGCDP